VLGGQQHEREHDQHGPDQIEAASARLDLIVEEEAEDRDRDRRHDQVPPHAGIDRPAQRWIAQ
jgi:hypothetical protein